MKNILIALPLLFAAMVFGQSSGLPAPSVVTLYPNAAITGTTLSTLTKLTGAPSTAVITSTSDTSGVIGITVSNAGTSGVAGVQVSGVVSLVFDGATTAGDYVQISSTVAGSGHDTGSTTCPSSGQVVGRVLSTNASGGTYQINLGANGCGSGGGSGSLNVNGSPVSSPNLQNSASVTYSVVGSNIQATASGSGGAYTNIPGSASQTTVSALNTLCSGGTLYVTTPLSIATGGTLTCPAQFSKAGVMTIASGQNVTFTYPVTKTDAPSQIFAGSGTVTLAAQDAPPEWFGEVVDGVYSTGAGTDNTAAEQATINALTQGNMVLSCGVRKVIGPVNIHARNNVGITGCQTASKNISTGAQVFTTSATATVYDFAGTGTTQGTYMYHNYISNLYLRRTVQPTGTATMLSLVDMCGAYVSKVYTEDSVRGFYLKGFGNCGTGRIEDSNYQLGFGNVTVPSNSVTYTGFYIDGADAPASTVLVRPGVGTNNITTVTTYGVRLSGALISDIMVEGLQTELTSYGIYIDGSAASGGFHASDIHFRKSILDACLTACIYVNTLSPFSTASAEFDGGWVQSTSGSYGIDIESSSGIIISNMTLSPNGGMTSAGVYLHSSQAISVVNNHYWGGYAGFGNPGGSIILDGSSNNTITGNAWVINTAGPIGNVALINGSTYNAIEGNAIFGGGLSNFGITADTTSCHNTGLNAIGAYTTAISDSCSGGTNRFIPAQSAGSAAAIQTADGAGGFVGTSITGIVKGNGASVPSQATDTDISSAQYIADTGAADAYVATLSPAVTSYTNGLAIRLKIANTNATTTPTLNVNGLGVKNIKKNGAGSVAAGDIASGQIQVFVYDGTNFQLLDPASTVNTVSPSSPIVASITAGTLNVSCPTCSTSSGGTGVTINGGSTLGTLNVTGNTTQACSDTSGSGTAQTCTTSTSFTPFTNACVVYTTTTTNSGTGLTVNVNSFGAKSVAIPGSSGWTTSLSASIIPANKPLTMCYDGTNWNVQQTGTAAGGSSGGMTLLGTYSATAATEIQMFTRNATGQSGNLFQSDFDYYLIKIKNLNFASSNTSELKLRVTTNGTSCDATSGNYNWAVWRFGPPAGSGVTGTGTDTGIALTDGLNDFDATAKRGGITASVEVANPTNSTIDKSFFFSGQLPSSSAGYSALSVSGGGKYLPSSAIAVTGICLDSTSANFVAASGTLGTISVFGLSH